MATKTKTNGTICMLDVKGKGEQRWKKLGVGVFLVGSKLSENE